MTALPVNVDSAYADDAGNASQKTHQQHHDFLHFLYNLFEQAIEDGIGTWDDGSIPFWVASNGQFSIIDPAISGSPGPQGDQGVGFLHRGNWSSSTSYNAVTVNDQYEVVLFGKHAYYALTTHTNSQPQVNSTTGAPVASTAWGVLASGGSDGVDGSDGSDGPQGPAGPAGPAGPSAEARTVDTLTGGGYTADAEDASYFVLTLNADDDITFADGLGREVVALTFRIVMGTGAPNAITWNSVDIWQTVDGLPPDLSGMSADDILSLTFDSVDGLWMGYNPGGGVGAPPPADVIPTIDMEDWFGVSDSTARLDTGDGVETYITSASYQVGNKKGAVVAVVNTCDDNADPPVPILSGAGASAWTQGTGASIVTPVTGTSRRRLTLFFARDAVSATAAPFTVTLPGLNRSNTGCVIKGVKSVGIVSGDWLGLAGAKTVARKYDDAGEVSGTTHAPLGAASDAANRPIVATCFNLNTTLTPLESFEVIGTPTTMINPTIALNFWWHASSFDTTPSATNGANTQWSSIGTELEQG